MARVVGFKGALRFDSSKPDGTPRKLLDVSRMKAFGWAPRIGMQDGIALAYREYVGRRAAQAIA
ncbi:GDP-L-fucose synthase [compost metagenome]